MLPTAFDRLPSIKAACDKLGMTDSMPNMHPYELEVAPHLNSATRWHWTIRRSGKIYQRADRRHPSEAKAREDGLMVIEKLLVSVERA
jgi:hypothetical protein